MAFGTQQRDGIAEFDGGGVLDIMHAMTVNTGCHVRVAFTGQGRAMHAGLVGLEDSVVAARAGVGNIGLLHLRKGLLRMGVMAIGAYSSIGVAFVQRPLVHTVQDLFGLVAVALFARSAVLNSNFAQRSGSFRGMGEFADVGMAVGTGDVFLAVNACFIGITIDVGRQYLAACQLGLETVLAVTGQADVARGAFSNRLWGGSCRGCPYHRQADCKSNQGWA